MKMNLQRQAFINLVGNVSFLFAQWLLTVITTQLLGYEAVGLLTLAMAIGNVFTFVQTYGVRAFQCSDNQYEFRPAEYVKTRILTTAAGIGMCIVFVLAGGYNKQSAYSILLFLLFRSADGFSDALHGEIQRAGRLELVGFSVLLRSMVTIIFFLAGIHQFHSTVGGLLFAAVGAICLTLFLDMTLYRRCVADTLSRPAACLSILKKCFPLFLAVIIPAFVTSYPRVILERFYGPELLGYYGNISTPTAIITAVIPNILVAFMPMYGNLVAKADGTGIWKLWVKTIMGTGGICVVCMLGVLIAGKPVMAFLYTDAIIPFVHYLYFFLITTMLYAMTMCGGSALIAMRKSNAVVIASIIPAVFCVLAAPPLVRQWEIPGTIITLGVSYLIQLGVQLFLINKAVLELNNG